MAWSSGQHRAMNQWTGPEVGLGSEVRMRAKDLGRETGTP